VGCPSEPVAVALTSAPRTLSYGAARQSPCLSCSTSPCCTHLPLPRISLRTLTDVDKAFYLLNFEGIVLWFDQNGTVRTYFHQPCDYLDALSGLCTVHGTPEQPSVCTHYNAYSCWYRGALTADIDSVQTVVDRRRLGWYADRLSFDELRRVVARPDWDEVLEAFESMPLERHTAPPPAPDPILEEWRSIAMSTKQPSGSVPPVHHFVDPVVSNPCDGCGAWCCKTLVFKRDGPENASDLDYFRYCLGFPGVEVGVGPDGWAVIVRTTCRHLVDNRCSVFGTDERPLKCSYYDALKCDYRIDFGTPRPPDMVRVSRAQFGVIADSFVFDDVGTIVAAPPLQLLRERLEDAMRAAV